MTTTTFRPRGRPLARYFIGLGVFFILARVVWDHFLKGEPLLETAILSSVAAGILLLLVLAGARLLVHRTLTLGDDGLHVSGGSRVAWPEVREARESGASGIGGSWTFHLRSGEKLKFDSSGLTRDERRTLRIEIARFLGDRCQGVTEGKE